MNDMEHAIRLLLSENRDESLDGEFLLYSLEDKIKLKHKMLELLGENEHNHSRACCVLHEIGTQEDTTQLLSFLTSDNSTIVRSTIWVLGRIGNSSIIAPLRDLWNSTNMLDLEIRFALSDLCDRMTTQELESFRSTDFELLKLLVQEQFSRQHRQE